MSTDAARGPRPGQKLSCEERRAAILRAVRRVFAAKGFDGTTTRELADAAGVSEALLFKHFPNKEALFSAMKLSLNEQDLGRLERIKQLEPSVSTLVLLVHFLTHLLIEGWTVAEDEPAIQTRLMLRSLAQDGEYARLLLRRVSTEWVPKIDECLKAAVVAGDASSAPVCTRLAGWLTQHVGCMAMMALLAPQPVVDYGMSRRNLVEQVVWFALRGMGVKDEAIRLHYNPRALELLESQP
jgi:AcrR family transcriptional regulator